MEVPIQGACILDKKVHFLHGHFSCEGGVFCSNFTVNVNMEIKKKGLLE